jgi:cation diffusion facilitator family transporter
MSQSTSFNREQADREKRFVALTSIAAALLLTGMKLSVGLWTNSLGILSEAAHSGLDLIAAGVTFLTVRVSGRPADVNHPYGHGKFENLSALFQTALLMVTCLWIVVEALRRLLLAEPVEVHPSVWAFAVVIFSIFIDYSRARALSRVARKYHSQALEADALHFSTDIWSSLVVLVGLFGVLLAGRLNLPWLVHADAIAALGVAAIVIAISIQLGKRAFDELSDAVPLHIRDDVVAAAAGTPGVEEVIRARMRRSGPDFFVDLTVSVARTAGFERAHEISDGVEEAIRQTLPNADVVVHVEPIAGEAEDLTATVQVLATRAGVNAHSIRVYRDRGRRTLEMHVEVERSLNLEQAHHTVSQFEQLLIDQLADVAKVVTHIEPAGAPDAIAAEPADEARVRELVDEFIHCCPAGAGAGELEVKMVDGGMTVSLHLTLERSTPITAAHDMTGQFEQFLRRRLPKLRRVVIHVEPGEP